jgi:hypothetical protein
MTTIKAHLSSVELEARYEAAADPVAKSHFHAVWLLSCGYDLEEVAELLSVLDPVGAVSGEALQRGRTGPARRPAHP